jgi:hypothetical protein
MFDGNKRAPKFKTTANQSVIRLTLNSCRLHLPQITTIVFVGRATFKTTDKPRAWPLIAVIYARDVTASCFDLIIERSGDARRRRATDGGQFGCCCCS